MNKIEGNIMENREELKCFSRHYFVNIIAMIVLVLILVQFASAESCYINIIVREEIVVPDGLPAEQAGSGAATFSLEVDNLYGFYDGFVSPGSGEFALKLYDSNDRLLNTYKFSSGRFLIIDTFNETEVGGMIESDVGYANIIVPYDVNIKYANIEVNGEETYLGEVGSSAKCERICKIAGESGNYDDGDRCCAGLNENQDETGDNFVCSDCGNGL